jgi:hypothetical protein
VTIYTRSTSHRRRRPTDAGFVPSDCPQAEADALIWLYNNAGGPNWTSKTGWLTDPIVNNWSGITVTAGHVVSITLTANNVNGNVGDWHLNGFSDLTALKTLRINANLGLTGDVSGWTLPATLEDIFLASTHLSGDLSGWTMPAPLWWIDLSTSQVAGDITGWIFTAELKYLYISDTGLTNVPDVSACALVRRIRYNNCALSQADVDAFLAHLYANRATYTYGALQLFIGQSNAIPSGAYADEDPPTTGQGYIYELCNDPEAEGFQTWTITYKANGGDVTKP